MRALHIPGKTMIRALLLGVCVWGVCANVARAQEAPAQAPAFLAVVEGNATLEREGEVVPAEQNMPFVQGDRLRTLDGRVQIVFPDGTAIEVAENSEVECISPTRVRLLAGTMDHVQRAIGGSQSATHLPPELDVYGGTFDQNGSWQYDAPVRIRLVSDRRRGLASVPLRLLVFSTAVRLHVDRRRCVRVADASLRTLGPRAQPVVLDSRTHVGTGVGVVGLGTRLRQLVPAWLRQPAGVRLLDGYGRSWAGWTILPRSNFGAHRYYAHRNGVDPRRIPANAAFVARNGPPASAARVGRVNSNNAPTVGVAVPRYPGQPPAGRQPPVGRQSPVGSPQSPAGSPQSPVGSLQSQAGRRQSPVGSQVSPSDTRPGNTLGGAPTVVRPGPYDGRQPTLGERRTPPQVQTHYGMPRVTTPTGSPAQAPSTGRPTLTPGQSIHVARLRAGNAWLPIARRVSDPTDGTADEPRAVSSGSLDRAAHGSRVLAGGGSAHDAEPNPGRTTASAGSRAGASACASGAGQRRTARRRAGRGQGADGLGKKG